MDLRLKGLAIGVVPRILRDVAVLDEDRVSVPVLQLARQEVTALEQQDALARLSQRIGKRPTACAAPNDDHVVVVVTGHVLPPCEKWCPAPASRESWHTWLNIHGQTRGQSRPLGAPCHCPA